MTASGGTTGLDASTKPLSRTDIGRVGRHISSRLIRFLISPRRRAAERAVREGVRRIRREPHRVHYFHEVGDAYSHLAAQTLSELNERYDIELVPHVTAPEVGPILPEPDLLATLARRDCAAVAPHYGLAFPAGGAPPSPASIRSLERLLVAALQEGPGLFETRAAAAGAALWSGDEGTLKTLCEEHAIADESTTDRVLEASRSLRSKRGHYSGATFYYAGEWYWGVDRLHHLEARLTSLGAAKTDASPRFPRPRIETDPVPRASEMTLEVFPSLRSPYTAIGFEPAVALAEHTGVPLEIRPVLPMVMRGLPVPMTKGLYIMRDTLREAAALGMPFGKLLDPVGEPVRRAYSLWPWAREQGRGAALLASFLRRAFAEGVDTSTDGGLREVVERAGLDWSAAAPHLGETAWEEELETNRLAMVDEMGLWGVPSFRLRGPEGAPDLCCWGQDRLWLIAREIQARGRTATP